MTQKAIVATIDYGFTQVEGLMHPNGDYAIAVPQICKFMSINSNQGSRTLKTMLGNGFQFDKWNSVLHPKKVNILKLKEFALIVYLLAKQGNECAEAFVLASLEETHERRFARAFGQKVEEDEWNERLKFRMKRVLARHNWTDVLMERHVELYGTKPKAEDYKRWTVKVNKHLFNQPHFCCDRDIMNDEQQKIIYDFESMARRRAWQNPTITPDELVLKALDTF